MRPFGSKMLRDTQTAMARKVALLVASVTCTSLSPQVHAAGKSSEDLLEVVVVTAQRREERLQDVPISIGVMSGEELDRSSSRGVADALMNVGGVSVIETQPGKASVTIRGVAADFNVGTSTAGYYLDEVPFVFITKAELPDANAFDLSRVEVLRGPQGTLYGASALSGVVRVLTNSPDLNEFEVKGRTLLSDTDGGENNYGGDLAVNVPLVPSKLAARGVASYSDYSGYLGTLSGEKHINDSESQAYRLKLAYAPIEDLSFVLGFSRSEINNGAPFRAHDNLITPFSSNQADERVYDTSNLVVQYDSSAWTLLSSTSYLDYRADTQSEIQYFPGFDLNFFVRFSLQSFAQELRFNSHLEGPWQFSAGGIYKDTKEGVINDAPTLFTARYEDQNESESYALFGEVTRAFYDDKIDVTGGIRYFNDDVTSTQLSDFSGGPVAAPIPASFDRVTGRVVLNYSPESDRMLYASIATGFRSGVNQNFAVATAAPELPALLPDSLLTYEVGTKGALFTGAFTYDAAVYYTEWKDIQQSLQLPGVGFNAYVNAGTASGAGVDASIAYHVNTRLRLQGTIGWSDLKLDEDIFSAGVALFNKGERVNLSPEWTGSVGANYQTPTPISDVELVFATSYSYRSELAFRYLATGGVSQTESETTTNLRASLGLAGDRWSAELFGDNLTNDLGAASPPNPLYANDSVRQRPRTIGLQATFKY